MEQELTFEIEIGDGRVAAYLDGHQPGEGDDARLTTDAILLALEEAGVTHGVLIDVIHELVQRAASGVPVERTLIARGESPTDGGDEEIQWLQQAGDFVAAGDELARVIPGSASAPGLSVTHQELPARDGATCLLTAGTGASHDEAERCVTATDSGLVTVQGEQITVSCTVTVASDAMTAAIDWPATVEGTRLPSFKELLVFIAQCGIQHGVDDGALMEFITRLRDGEQIEGLVLAHGRAPQKGLDSRLALKFSPNLKPGLERPDGTMDYRARDFGASIVEKDAVIATLLAPEAGKAGCDVRGDPIEAIDGALLELKVGEGVRTSADGNTFYAELDGRGVLKDGLIAVHEMVIIEGDVDFNTGHVDAQSRGVEVTGDVRSNFNVESGGTMIIHGSVGDSHCTSVSDMSVDGGIVQSADGGTEVRCHASVIVHHTQNARIRAAGDVTITHGAINSDIRARGQVVAPPDAGRIVGGSVLASGGIVAHSVGSASHVQTRLAVSTAQETLDLLEEERADIDARMVPLRAMLGEKNMESDGQGLPPALRDVYDALQQLARSLEEVDGASATVAAEADAGRGTEATVQVLKVAHPGVTVAIGGRSFTLTIALVQVEFFFDHENRVVDYRPISTREKDESASDSASTVHHGSG